MSMVLRNEESAMHCHENADLWTQDLLLSICKVNGIDSEPRIAKMGYAEYARGKFVFTGNQEKLPCSSRKEITPSSSGWIQERIVCKNISSTSPSNMHLELHRPEPRIRFAVSPMLRCLSISSFPDSKKNYIGEDLLV